MDNSEIAVWSLLWAVRAARDGHGV